MRSRVAFAEPPETHAPAIAAQPSQPISAAHGDFTELQAEIAVEVDVEIAVPWAHLKALAELERRIGALYTELQPDDVRHAIPGVGQHLAPVLLPPVVWGCCTPPSGSTPSATSAASPASSRDAPTAVAPKSRARPSPKAAPGAAPGAAPPTATGDRIKRALRLAADIARKIGPDPAEIYWRLMTIRGHHHKQALCAVANRLADRIFSMRGRGDPAPRGDVRGRGDPAPRGVVMRRGKPCVLRDRDGRQITTAEAKALVTEQFTVPEAIRASRRANRAAIAA